MVWIPWAIAIHDYNIFFHRILLMEFEWLVQLNLIFLNLQVVTTYTRFLKCLKVGFFVRIQ